MWARVHKLDRVRAQPGGGAIIVIEDERNVTLIQRSPGLSTLIAVARVLAARRALEAKFDGKGEIRYAATTVPSFLSDAVTRAGASVATRDGERVIVPAQPAGVAAMIDIAFSELAGHVRGTLGIVDVTAALKHLEEKRHATPLDRDKQPELYWPAVFELSALAGEQARSRGGRWIDTRDLPVPFAIKFADGAVSHPTAVAQKIVEGGDARAVATDKPATDKPAAPATDKPAAPATDKPATDKPPTEPATDKPTATATDKPTAPATDKPTAPATDKPAAPTTDKPVDKP